MCLFEAPIYWLTMIYCLIFLRELVGAPQTPSGSSAVYIPRSGTIQAQMEARIGIWGTNMIDKYLLWFVKRDLRVIWWISKLFGYAHDRIGVRVF